MAFANELDVSARSRQSSARAPAAASNDRFGGEPGGRSDPDPLRLSRSSVGAERGPIETLAKATMPIATMPTSRAKGARPSNRAGRPACRPTLPGRLPSGSLGEKNSSHTGSSMHVRDAASGGRRLRRTLIRS